MALATTHRWITVGNVLIRNRKSDAPGAPKVSLHEVIAVASERLNKQQQIREFGRDKTKVMWFSGIEERSDYYWLLAETGDQNATGISFLDFQTRKTRDIEKRETEGSHYAAHVAISKTPLTNDTGHLLLAEKVPGIHLSSLKDHFAWLCRDDSLQKDYEDDGGKHRKASAVFEVDGYQSGTIRDALRTGTLQDIEFIQSVEGHEDGLDENSVVRQIVREAKWDVKAKVTEEQARSVFEKARAHWRGDFRKPSPEAEAKMFIRIKTDAGQIRRAAVDEDDENILDQAFVQNEFVGNFETPLSQRHDTLRDDMVRKMQKIIKQISDRNKVDA